MQRDLVLRWLEQIALVIRRLLSGPGPVDIELAERKVTEALEQHLGPLAPLVARLDPLSAANLLHDHDRIFGYARLVELEALIMAKRGDPRAGEHRARARALGEIAAARVNPVPEPWSAWLRELADR